MSVIPARYRIDKLALCFGGANAEHEVNMMLARQNLCDVPAVSRPLPRGAIGCLGRDRLPAEDNMLIFAGVPIHGPAPGEITDAQAAARLLPSFDGAFVGVFWDAGRQILVVATDFLGMQPLYMRRRAGELTLVSETKAVNGKPDLAAWGAFISIGHPVGDRSLMADLERVPPATILTYDCRNDKLSLRRYWDWPAASDGWRRYDFIGALEADMHAYSVFEPSAQLLLSGGFDSRLLLFLLEHMGLPANALIVTHDEEHDDADGRLAEQVAVLAGIEYRKQRPPAGFFSSANYVDYLVASDAGYPSLELFIAKVAAHIQTGAVWEGLAPGFVFMPLHQPEGGFPAYTAEEIRGPESAIWQAARLLFRPDIADAMYEGFRDDIDTVFAGLPQNAEGLARFVIENRSRNRAAMNPLKVYANRATAFTPGLSKDFIAHAIGIPMAEKQHGRFYLDLFARLDRRALKIPFLSGGELIKPRRGSLGYHRESIRMQFNTLRARHPRAFEVAGRAPRGRSNHSVFLDQRLLDTHDPYLNPDIAARMRESSRKVQHQAWKLLFHWKAWHWAHEARLHDMLRAGPASQNSFSGRQL